MKVIHYVMLTIGAVGAAAMAAAPYLSPAWQSPAHAIGAASIAVVTSLGLNPISDSKQRQEGGQ